MPLSWVRRYHSVPLFSVLWKWVPRHVWRHHVWRRRCFRHAAIYVALCDAMILKLVLRICRCCFALRTLMRLCDLALSLSLCLARRGYH